MSPTIASKHEDRPNPAIVTACVWPGHMCNGSGTTSGATPGAVLSANQDELVLRGKLGDFRIPRTSVVRVNRGQMYPWMFAGFRIQHNVAGVPPDLQFKPTEASSRDVLAQLKELGFPAA